MKRILYLTPGLFILILLMQCVPDHQPGTFGYDLDFLQKHQDIITLKANHGKSQIIVAPDYQGRVMTSTATGLKGNSYGWINYDLIASGTVEEHINVYGGEDRFWMGPEGGQYAIFFKKGSAFTFDNWFTPKEIDTEPFEVQQQTDDHVAFSRKMQIVNYQDYRFDIQVNRTIRIFGQQQIEGDLGITLDPGVNFVGYESDNEIVNTGDQPWSKESGLLSIWILGMYTPSANTTVIIPYRDSLALNTSYFGEIPPERLTLSNQHVLFKGDGTLRFKLGLPPKNIVPFIGSYDADNNTLTVVHYSFQGDTIYVNSLWRLQEQPYAGDVVNAYNDGPLEGGGQLGPFYEMESSSNTRELKPGESLRHQHSTYHFEGSFDDLNTLSKKLLGMDLKNLQ